MSFWGVKEFKFEKIEMKKIKILDIGTVRYAEALELQHSYFDRVSRCEGDFEESEAGVLIFVEHPHVYTLGKSGDAHNLLISSEFLSSINAEYFKTDRGGDITYHGFGQLVGYPILNLSKLGVSLREYINLLEQSIMDTVAKLGIESGRVEGATGVWIEGDSASRARKIAAIGVRASRQTTMHGFALNVSTDLRYFSYINPCGMADKGVTSVERELGVSDMSEVKRLFVESFEKNFNVICSD